MNRMAIAQGFFGWVQIVVSSEGYARGHCWKCGLPCTAWSNSMSLTKLLAEQHAVGHSAVAFEAAGPDRMDE